MDLRQIQETILISEDWMKRTAILGSTGSIGTQALDVIRNNNTIFSIEVLTAGSNSDLLIRQAKEFLPHSVVIAEEKEYKKVSDALLGLPIHVFAGQKSVEQIVESPRIDIVLTAMVGFSGLIPTVNAIKSGKNIALANKETLVAAGEIINALVKQHGVELIPVDSEHSAVFQCLSGEYHNEIEKIYLTASGGPFRTKSLDELKNVTVSEALNHPNWDMGAKITIDSATMMNKGLEAIEAKWLFDLKPEQIDIIIHPQSVIHSIVQFTDGSMKAQMGMPDMKLPIQYALTWPDRIKNEFKRFDFLNYPELSFHVPDTEKFPCIKIAFDAMHRGGNIPCAMNAANEIAVKGFLEGKINFTQIPEIIEKTIYNIIFAAHPSLDDYIETDKEARKKALEFIH
jgi:1-deoxy-D-xylulose-5-phosphate reductoisomerase